MSIWFQKAVRRKLKFVQKKKSPDFGKPGDSKAKSKATYFTRTIFLVSVKLPA